MQPLVQRTSVRLGRSHRDIEHPADRLDRIAAGQQHQHFILPRGDLQQLRARTDRHGALGGSVLGVARRQGAHRLLRRRLDGLLAGEALAAGHDQADGRLQDFDRSRFHQAAVDAASRQALHRHRQWHDVRQKQDPLRRQHPLDFMQRAPRFVGIHRQSIDQEIGASVHAIGLGNIRQAHPLDFPHIVQLAKNLPQPQPQERMGFNQDHLGHGVLPVFRRPRKDLRCAEDYFFSNPAGVVRNIPEYLMKLNRDIWAGRLW